MAIAAAAALTFSPAVTPQAAAAPQDTWEYLTAALLPGAAKQILDLWGADGWELVQVVVNPNDPEQLVAYFKRALPAWRARRPTAGPVTSGGRAGALALTASVPGRAGASPWSAVAWSPSG
ncbi:hypothetical protein, partial [Streptomyces syringium]|uniref:hypothetical protein n=1 Tax=Streptomyces syringium TaxID=76729 RepID=UPI003F566F6A